MIGIFIVQLPFSACLVWTLLLLLKRRKSQSDKFMMIIMLFLAVFFLCGSGYVVPAPKYERLALYNALMQFTSLCICPLICLYIRSCYEETRVGFLSYLLFLPAVLLTTSCAVLTALLGTLNTSNLLFSIQNGLVVMDLLSVVERSYILISFRVYRMAFFVFIALTLIYVFSKLFVGRFKFKHISAFLRGQKTSFVANVLCILFVIFLVLWAACSIFSSIFMNPASIWSPVWSFVTAIVLFLVGYIGAVPALPGGYINMERLAHPFNAMNQSPQEYMSGIDSGPIGDRTTGYDKIMDSFKDLMETQQGFRDPNMTIDVISHDLNSNRTYVSKLVNIYYGMPFRDYLSRQRIDYAKSLMTDEPDASLDYIAAKSGFQSSTQFIRKFKELESTTPSVWRSSLTSKKG